MAADFTRDRWGRPLIVPPDGGKPVAYGRFSSHGAVLEDKFALEKWKIRTSAIGLTKRDDLFAQLSACPTDDSKRLDEIMAQALEAGGGSIGANLGTALHEFTQRIDLGEITLDDIAEPWRSDVAAYRETLEANNLTIIPELIEVNLVNDLLQLAGTADRFYRHPELGVVCADIKTGKQISKNPLAYAVQLAAYAFSERYDIETGKRSRISNDMYLQVGYIMHIPAGQARCDIYEVDLHRSMEAARLARTVKEWQKRDDLVKPMNPAPKKKPADKAVKPADKAVKPADKAPETPSESPVTASNPERNTWVRGRLQPVLEACKSELVALWPADIPTPSKADQWTDAQIDEICVVLHALETAHDLGFYPPDPTLPKPQLRRFSFETDPEEGGIEDDIIIIGIKARLAELPKPQLDFVQNILTDATKAKVSINLKQKKTKRRARIIDALISLSFIAGQDDEDIELIRTIVSTVRSPLPDLPLGHILGTFTMNEAERLEQLAQRIHAGEAVIDINDDGSITFKEAS